MLKELTFKIARKRSFGKLVGFLFASFSPIIPVRKLLNNKNVIAFFHPVPSYEQHVLIVPKKIIGRLFDLKYSSIFDSVIEAAISVSNQIVWENKCIILCANGGSRQDVKQLHFHLFSAETILPQDSIENTEVIITNDDRFCPYNIALKKFNKKSIIEIALIEGENDGSKRIHKLFKDFPILLKLLDDMYHFEESGFTIKILISENSKIKTGKIYIDF